MTMKHTVSTRYTLHALQRMAENEAAAQGVNPVECVFLIRTSSLGAFLVLVYEAGAGTPVGTCHEVSIAL